jgi:hypothetical protein
MVLPFMAVVDEMGSGLAFPKKGGSVAFDNRVAFFAGAFKKRLHEDSGMFFTTKYTKCHEGNLKSLTTKCLNPDQNALAQIVGRVEYKGRIVKEPLEAFLKRPLAGWSR